MNYVASHLLCFYTPRRLGSMGWLITCLGYYSSGITLGRKILKYDGEGAYVVPPAKGGVSVARGCVG